MPEHTEYSFPSFGFLAKKNVSLDAHEINYFNFCIAELYSEPIIPRHILGG